MDENKYEAQGQEVMPLYQEALAKAAAGGAMNISAVAHRPTISEMLQQKKANLEYELKCVNDALDKAGQEQTAMGLLDALAKARVPRDY